MQLRTITLSGDGRRHPVPKQFILHWNMTAR
jgi:hypothetical protein